MDIEEAGYKFQMNDIAASIVLSGLKYSNKWLRYRRKIANYYTRELKCTGVSGGSYWLYGIMVGNRDKVAEKLKEAGIETNMAHLRNDIFTVFGGERLILPVMNEVESKYLYIPINTHIIMKDVKYIAKTLNAIL